MSKRERGGVGKGAFIRQMVMSGNFGVGLSNGAYVAGGGRKSRRIRMNAIVEDFASHRHFKRYCQDIYGGGSE